MGLINIRNNKIIIIKRYISYHELMLMAIFIYNYC